MKESHLKLWEDCLKIFKDNLPAEQFDAWFKPITSKSFEGNELRLRVPTSFFVERLEEQYARILLYTLHKVYGPGVKLFYEYNQIGSDPDTSVAIESVNPSPAVRQRPAILS